MAVLRIARVDVFGVVARSSRVERANREPGQPVDPGTERIVGRTNGAQEHVVTCDGGLHPFVTILIAVGAALVALEVGRTDRIRHLRGAVEVLPRIRQRGQFPVP